MAFCQCYRSQFYVGNFGLNKGFFFSPYFAIYTYAFRDKLSWQVTSNDNACIQKIRSLQCKRMKSKNKTKSSTAGFEPARAKPNRFQVCLLNHSDISTRLLIAETLI